MSQLLLLPELGNEERDKPVNVASVPQRSPFRYPGGKTWLIPLFRRWVGAMFKKPALLVEPFAGGGIISMTAAFEDLAERVLMVEMDAQVAAVWRTILGKENGWLANRMLTFELTVESAKAELAKKAKSTRELAFQTLLKNRTVHGGILAEGSSFLKHGENGRGILSRWYPQTIARRITNIEYVADRIDFVQGDGFEVMLSHAKNRDAVFFIDPPYTAGGKKAGSRLYTHCEVDHERLFEVAECLRGEFLMTYDNAEEVRQLARKHGFQMKPVAMKNTHHAEMTELLISRDLDWLEETPRVQEPRAEYRVRRKRGKR